MSPMDELNYRRLTGRPKLRCEACGATSYQDEAGVFRCVVCDHDRFEMCLDCGQLRGWCECPPPAPAVRPTPRPARKTARRTKAATSRSRK